MSTRKMIRRGKQSVRAKRNRTKHSAVKQMNRVRRSLSKARKQMRDRKSKKKPKSKPKSKAKKKSKDKPKKLTAKSKKTIQQWKKILKEKGISYRPTKAGVLGQDSEPKYISCKSLLDETSCEENHRCIWNTFDPNEFDINTIEGREKLKLLQESIMKSYSKEQLRKVFRTETPTYLNILWRVNKEYEDGLRGSCGEKMYMDSLGEELKKRINKKGRGGGVAKDGAKEGERELNPDWTKKIHNLLMEAEKSVKPDEEIQKIIKKFEIDEQQLAAISEQHTKLLDRVLNRAPIDSGEVNRLLESVSDEVRLERRSK